MSDSESVARARGRRHFLILAGLFLLPVLASVVLYFGNLWRPASSSAKGELIEPARTLDYAGVRTLDGAAFDLKTLEGRWTIIYIGQDCDELARTALTYGRQSRLALGKDMGRVQRVFIRSGNCTGLIGESCCPPNYLETEQPGLIRLQLSAPDSARLLQQFPGDVPQSIYIVDPHHNLMMRHDARVVVNKALLTDLKKLLKLSQIG